MPPFNTVLSMTLSTLALGNLSAPARQCRSEVDDAGLIAAARRGDAEAFSALFARYQGPLFRYAAHMCGREAGDDVVQETFLAVLRDPVRYDAARGSVGAYLFGIARHQVFRRLRSRGAPDDDAAVGDAAVPAVALDHLTRLETIEAVRGAIESLPPVFREVVVLCELQEMSYGDAAGIIGCPLGTVRSRLHRAKSMLTARLAAHPAVVVQR